MTGPGSCWAICSSPLLDLHYSHTLGGCVVVVFFMDVWLSPISTQNRSTYACMSAPTAAAHDVPGVHSPLARFVLRHLKAHETSASRRPHLAGKHAQWRHLPSSRPVQPFETFREPLALKCSALLLKQESLTQFLRPCQNVKSL